MNRFFFKFQILNAVLFFMTAQLSYSHEPGIISGEHSSIASSEIVLDALEAGQLQNAESVSKNMLFQSVTGFPQQVNTYSDLPDYDNGANTLGTTNSESLPLPFYEGFEASNEIPDGWTQEVVNGPLWTVGNGNSPFPSQAYAGTHNLVFRSHIPYATGLITRLVTPPLDMTGTDTAVLKFYYANAGIYNFFLYLDRLTIKYKSALEDEWTTIETFHDDLRNWTEVSIVLPNLSNTYYIAFEGESRAGIGISIDEITINAQQIESFAITAGASGNGSITPSGQVLVPAGENQQFNVEADNGHHISSLLVDGQAIAAAEGEAQFTFTFESVTAAHTIMAYFLPDALNVTVEVVPSEAGSVGVQGEPFYGNTITLSAVSAGDEYVFSHWTSNGVTLGTENPLIFVLQSDTLIQAHFRKANLFLSQWSDRVRVYPNPVLDFLNIDLPAEAFVQVFDLQGKLRFEASLPAGNRRINLSGFDQATYILRLQFEDQVVTKRIIRF
jgi:hypothetical protein